MLKLGTRFLRQAHKEAIISLRDLERWCALIGVFLGLAGCQGAIEVKTARPERLPVELSFTSSGYVKGREVQVQSTLPSKIVRVLVSEGQRVEEGDLLVLLDDSTLQQRLSSAQRRRSTATAAVDRARQALAVSKIEIERAIRQAEAQVESAKARYRVVKAGARRQEIAQAEHRVRQAEAALQEAENSAERMNRLHQEGAISQADRDRARERQKIAQADLGIAREALRLLRAGATLDELAVAQADIASAQAALRQAEARRAEFAVHEAEVQMALRSVEEVEGPIEEARAALRDTRIAAPISGVIDKADLEPGELLQPGMLTLVDTRKLYVEAELGESDLGAIYEEQNVEVRSASYPGVVFPGLVVRVATSAEPKPDMSLRTRIVRAHIAIFDTRDRLKPGMEVDVDGSRKLEAALVIPESALISDGAKERVFVLDSGRALAVEVQSGQRFAAKVAILKGLSGKESIILDPPLTLSSGDAIREVK